MALKPQTKTPVGLWRRTPPAIFPSVMGLFGLGLAWRRAVHSFAVPEGIGEVILGAASLLFLFALLAYVAKVLRRPTAIIEDLRILPGRAGLAALALCQYLLLIALEPYLGVSLQPLLTAAIAVHAALVLLLLWAFFTGPSEQRRVTPDWHLCFVGFIIAALAATRFGNDTLALMLFALTAIVAIWIWAVSLEQLLKETVPAPLRPMLAIHLSPAALFGMVALALGLHVVAHGFAVLSAAILLFLIVRVRWLTEAGFSALWGAFTFPIAATASLWISLDFNWRTPGGIALVMATLIVPWIALRVTKLWASGQLAQRTNAAMA